MKPKSFDESTVAALRARKWPGNVRELKSVVERAAILSSGDRITIADQSEDPHENPFEQEGGGGPRRRRQRAVRGRHAAAPVAGVRAHDAPRLPRPHGAPRHPRQLRELERNISRAAITLGVERTNLHKKIRAYGLKRGEG